MRLRRSSVSGRLWVETKGDLVLKRGDRLSHSNSYSDFSFSIFFNDS
jgi:hypothetical protein